MTIPIFMRFSQWALFMFAATYIDGNAAQIIMSKVIMVAATAGYAYMEWCWIRFETEPDAHARPPGDAA